MESFLSLLVAWLSILGQGDMIQLLQAQLNRTLGLIEAVIGDDSFSVVKPMTINSKAVEIMAQGGVLLASWGDQVPNAINLVGKLTGGMSSQKAMASLPTVFGMPVSTLRVGKNEKRAVRTRLTFFTKTKGIEGVELRVQTNTLRNNFTLGLLAGDPIRFVLLVADIVARTNIAAITANIESFAGWLLVGQVSVEPFIKEDEVAMGQQQTLGARADRTNIVNGQEREPALMNVLAYRLWLVPPGSEIEKRSQAMAMVSEFQLNELGDEVRVKRPRPVVQPTVETEEDLTF